ncbi:MAG: ATP-binding protein [Acidobacteriota bacterium]
MPYSEPSPDLLLRDRALAHTSCGVTIADVRQTDVPLIYVNEAFLNMTGYLEGDVLGRNCRFLQGQEREQSARGELRRALESGSDCRVVLRNYRQDGTAFWNELTMSPVRSDVGTLTHFIGVQTVVTEREEAWRERARLVSRLREVNRQLEDFAHTVSHDLRAPLRAIRNAAQMLQQDVPELDEKAQYLIDVLVHRSQRLGLMVKGILQYSQVSQDELNLRPVAMDHLVADVLDLLDPGSSFRIEVSEDLPTINGDPSLLSQIFQNLIGNALQHHPGPQGTVTVRWGEEEGHWRFEVEDDGAGIPADQRSAIFKTFTTVGETESHRGADASPDLGPSGMGLSIVRRAVERLGGEVVVEDGATGGARFCVLLPQRSASGADAARAASS